MEPNLKHPLKKMGKHDQIVAAQVYRLAIYVNFYQNFVTITYSIQNHKAIPLFLVHQIIEEGIKI
jgi:hypothetical protein